jgi:hypothetical protein
MGCPTGITAAGYSDKVIVIGRNPLFDGLPGWLDERNRGTDTLYRCLEINFRGSLKMWFSQLAFA